MTNAPDIIKTINSLLSSNDVDKFTEACRVYNEIDDDEVFSVVSKSFPRLSAYDRSGNYIGAVSNENGWTP